MDLQMQILFVYHPLRDLYTRGTLKMAKLGRGLRKAQCVRKKIKEGKSKTKARKLCGVKGAK